MKGWGTRAIALATIVLGALSAWPAAAQSPRPPGPPGGGGGVIQNFVVPPPGAQGAPPPPDVMLVSILIRGANLNFEQQLRVGAIMSARQATIRVLIDRLRKTEDDLADSLLAPGQSTDFQGAITRVSQIREQLLQESVRAAVEVRGVLTPEQLARATYVKDRMRALQTEMRELTHPRP